MAKARIMVVEDEGVVAMQVAETLKGLGYEVPVIAMTGEEAVAKLLETEPDLVLMDIHLRGGVSGIEAAHRIRQRLDVPIVYLTAFSDSETLEQAQLTERYRARSLLLAVPSRWASTSQSRDPALVWWSYQRRERRRQRAT